MLLTSNGRPPKPGPRWKVVGIPAILLVAIGALIAGWVRFRQRQAPDPAFLRVEPRALVALGTADNMLWRQPLDPGVSASGYEREPRWTSLVHLDGDGRSEVLFVHLPVNEPTAGSVLRCYGSDGTPRWTFLPGGEVRDRNQAYTGGYLIQRFATGKLGRGNRMRLVVSSRHHTDFPTQVALIDLHNGALLQRTGIRVNSTTFYCWMSTAVDPTRSSWAERATPGRRRR